MGSINKKERNGIVVSDASDKTIVVKVVRIAQHSRYGKLVRIAKKYHAHDEANKAKIGDTVTISECRPLSKNKRWLLKEIVVNK